MKSPIEDLLKGHTAGLITDLFQHLVQDPIGGLYGDFVKHPFEGSHAGLH